MTSSINDDPDSLLTEVHAARLLRMSERTLQTWRIKGTGPSFIRAGRAVRYRRCDILAWIEANAVVRHDSEA